MMMQKSQLVQQIKDLREKGYSILHADETCFTRKTIAQSEYCRPRESMITDQRLQNESCHALLMSISVEEGIDLAKVYPKSVNIDKFIDWLEDLRAKYPDRLMACFLDNLQVHKAKRTREKLDELGIVPIYNLPYSPEYNPIELIFSIVKNKYKRLRSHCLIQNQVPDIESLIAKAIDSVQLSNIINCINHCDKLLT